MQIRSAILIVVIMSSGCAEWHAQAYDKEFCGKSGPQGYTVYRPEPYLLVVQGTIASDSPSQPPKQSPPKKKGGKSGSANQSLIDPSENSPSSTSTAKRAATQHSDDDVPEFPPTTEETGKDRQNNRPQSPAPSSSQKAAPVQYTAKIIWLPNYGHPTRIWVKNWMAKSNFQFTFTDGWQLSSISDQGDSTTVATSLMSMVSALAKPGPGGTGKSVNSFMEENPPATPPDIDQVVGVYKFEIDEETGDITGLKRLKPSDKSPR